MLDIMDLSVSGEYVVLYVFLRVFASFIFVPREGGKRPEVSMCVKMAHEVMEIIFPG